ncbi:MAG: hypothetical protein MI919_32210, partial [Holophagales bacterium]|nr:hypothetical protein [Holophagales bacterium]
PAISDVDAHIRQAHKPSPFSAWITPIATILIPNLVDIVKKRRAYLEALEDLRNRLEAPAPGS